MPPALLAEEQAEKLARQLDGSRRGDRWVACCPVHEERTPSFTWTISGDRLLYHCHGCHQQEKLTEELRRRGIIGNRSRTSRRPRPTVASPPAMPPTEAAELIARARDGRRVGDGWRAEAACHDDLCTALVIQPAADVIYLHCGAGCEPRRVEHFTLLSYVRAGDRFVQLHRLIPRQLVRVA